jgi:hypothetical protein
MKQLFIILFLLINIHAQNTLNDVVTEKDAEHQAGANKVAIAQDSLSADVQQLKIEQTQPAVIQLLDEVENIMQDAIDQLEKENTGGETIAAQTEVIEKIYQAAKKKQNQADGESAQGMMEMMKRMMGETLEKPKKKSDKKTAADGAEGDNFNKINTKKSGEIDGQKFEERRIQKSSGSSSENFPEEFKKALDSYNRILSK